MPKKKAAAKQSPSSKTIGILKSLKTDDWVKLLEKIIKVSTPVSSEWLVANGFPNDLHRAVKIAIAELGEFATTEDVESFPMDNIRELLQTCVDRRQWLAKINKTPSSASSVDQDRLKFYQDQLKANPRLKYKHVAELWNKTEQDCCDGIAFKQSCYRAKKKVTT